MDHKEWLTQEISRLKAEAQSVIDKAQAENRNRTEDENTEIEVLAKRAEEHSAELSRLEADEALKDRIAKMGTVTVTGAPEDETEEPAKNPGDALVKSPSYKAFKATPENQRPPRFAFSAWVKDITPILTSDGNNDQAITPGWDPELAQPGLIDFPVTVTSLIPTIPFDGLSISHPIVAGKTPPGSGDEPVDEGDPKPQASYSFDSEQVTLEKVAAVAKVSSELIEAAPALASFIDSDLPQQVRIIQESRIIAQLYDDAELTADGSNVGGTNGFDAILDGQTQGREKGFELDTLVITPMDWATLLASKFEGGDGHYVGGGVFGSTGSPWSVRNVVVTPRATAGVPLLAGFSRGTKLYVASGGMRVDVTNSNEDDFINNLVAIRAEIRSGLGVTYPESLCTVTLGS